MTLPAPTYDLVLLIDPKAEDSVRAKIVADARSTIEAKGELLRHDEWGERALTYPIDRKTSAEYHLLQFHAATPELLDGLKRSLQILDDILRFRIVKLRPGVPDAPDMQATAPLQRRSEPEAPIETPAKPASETAAEPAIEAQPQTQPEPELPSGAVELEVGDPA
jgi:small subunit ribosomal protein S6